MEIAYCMKCKCKQEFVKEPIYTEYKTSRGIKPMLLGSCKLGHKMSKICKVRA